MFCWWAGSGAIRNPGKIQNYPDTLHLAKKKQSKSHVREIPLVCVQSFIKIGKHRNGLTGRVTTVVLFAVFYAVKLENGYLFLVTVPDMFSVLTPVSYNWLMDTNKLEEERKRLQGELSALVRFTQDCVAENARIAQDQDEYRKRYDSLAQKYEVTKANYNKVEADITDKQSRRERLMGFIRLLKGQETPLAEFDSHLWGCLVDYVTVGRDKEMSVTFRDGTEIKV